MQRGYTVATGSALNRGRPNWSCKLHNHAGAARPVAQWASARMQGGASLHPAAKPPDQMPEKAMPEAGSTNTIRSRTCFTPGVFSATTFTAWRSLSLKMTPSRVTTPSSTDT